MFGLASGTMTASFQAFSPLNGPFIGSIENVLPRVAANDPPNRRRTDAVVSGNALFGLSSGQCGLYGPNVIFGEFGSVVVAAMGHVASALRQFVAIVVAASAKPQVIGIDAALNVARMANAHAGRNRTVNVLVHQPVRSIHAPVDVDLSVAKNSALLAVPDPATFLLVDLVPKSLRKVLHGGNIPAIHRRSNR